MLTRVVLASLLAMPAAAAMGEEAVLRIVSYNIRHARGMDDEVDPARIAAVLRDLRPDIVCLQEVDQDQPRSGNIDLTQVLAEALGMEGVFGPNYFFSGGAYGNATLSRFPIVEHDNLPLPTPEGIEPRGALRTVIDVDGVALEVWNTHWGLRPDQRRAQAAAMLAALATTMPVLVVGDLNEEIPADGVSMLLGPLRDTWSPEAGVGTFPVDVPRRRIDYILASPEVVVLEHRIVHTDATRIASDHLPVVAMLAIPRRAPGAEAESATADALLQAGQDPERAEP